MSKPSISVVYPVYLPSEEHLKMTNKNLMIAKRSTFIDCEWVIVETESRNYLDEADVYIYEKNRTNPIKSINRAFNVCSGDYIVYLSNDLTVCERWIEFMYGCFDKHEDCGLASLGSNEHNDIVKDEIVEGMYFSVCMMKREDAKYDSNYTMMFCDTDLLFKIYLSGKKFYKNLAGLTYHKRHSTYGHFGGNMDEYQKSREYFINKYSEHKEDKFFKQLAGIN